MVQQKEEYLVDNLKHLRKLFEMTQQDAADQFEVKKSAYASYEEEELYRLILLLEKSQPSIS